ncbi:MAG TPA: hypothetical protein VHB98_09800 [Chloroflexota bacterium]|jgi:hypothetical protein|nr:hypothetical protein [Chloroflexota bacterium]
MSPQLLLVLMVALLAATLTGLFTRRPIYYLPLYWLVSVCALLIGQEIGRAAGWTFLTVGDVEIGAGIAINILAVAGLSLFGLWYNQQRSKA